ncbi:MAG TPA: hypothetical protein VNT22_05530 [Baekduia sp.]|nr:hypothetical protein [Baekduia sp.]
MPQPKSSSTKAAYDAINAARSNPYVQRLIEDQELRDTIRAAFVSAQDAYQRVQKAKAPQKVVMDDKKFHRDLANAAEALRDAGTALRHGPKRDSGHTLTKALVITGLIALAALAVSSDLREKVLDLLFGAEEEFDYMSTTSPASTASDNGGH